MSKLVQSLAVIFVLSICLFVFPVSMVTATENSWITMTSMPSAGGYEAAVVNGKIYVFGNNFTYEYDPAAADAWNIREPKPAGTSISTVAAFQNKVYMFSETTAVYDPATDTWETKTAMPTIRSGIEANAVDGKIYLISGRTGGPYSTVNVTEVYDPVTDSWTTKAPIPYPVVNYASAVVDNRIYVVGGQDEFYPGMYVDFNQIYDTESDTWSQGTPIPAAKRAPALNAGACATTGGLAPKRIHVIGGEVSMVEASNQHYIYDPETDNWISGALLPTSRINPAVAVVNDSVYVMGGWTSGEYGLPFATAAVERYTPFLLGTVPAVSVSSPENKTYAVTEVALNFTVNEQVSWTGYSLNGQQNVTANGNTTLSGLTEGTHSIAVYAEDMVGDVGASETITFTVDKTPPNITVQSPEAKEYDGSDVPLIFVVDEPFSKVTYSLDGQDNVTAAGNVTLTGLAEGVHNVTVYAWDIAGNVAASETVSFTVDVPEPEPFPTAWIAAATVPVAVVIAGLIFYLRKRRQ